MPRHARRPARTGHGWDRCPKTGGKAELVFGQYGRGQFLRFESGSDLLDTCRV